MKKYTQFKVTVKDSPRQVGGRSKVYFTERGMRGAVARARAAYKHAEVRGCYEDSSVAGGFNWEPVEL